MCALEGRITNLEKMMSQIENMINIKDSANELYPLEKDYLTT